MAATLQNAYKQNSQFFPLDIPKPNTDQRDNGANTRTTVNMSNLDMKKEADRLKTFENWPVSFMDPCKLAKAGFYYMNVDDRVKCEFCKVEVGRWVEHDDANIDHQRWAPNCPFLRNRPVGNVPIDGEVTSPQPGPSYDVCGHQLMIRPNAVPENSAQLLSMGVQVNKGPEHPEYATENARMKSYATWPSSIRQRPNELSDAGFFYTGQGDRTVCFHCGGGLKDWEVDDSPWEQHARWFPKCIYVQLLKGPEYIKQVNSTLGATLTPAEAKDLEVRSSVNNVNGCKSGSSSPVSEQPPLLTGSPTKLSIPVPDEKLCRICYIEEKNAVFIPCGHVVSCIKCSLSVKECPVCRAPYTGVMRVFFS